MATKQSSIYLSDKVRSLLRTPPRGQSAAVSATIDRYYSLIESERKRLAVLLSPSEWDAVRGACVSTDWTGTAPRGGVLANIQDSLDEELEAFGADRATLEAKLAALPPVAQYALVEMIEEYWEQQGPTESDA